MGHCHTNAQVWKIYAALYRQFTSFFSFFTFFPFYYTVDFFSWLQCPFIIRFFLFFFLVIYILPFPECGKGFRYKVSQRSHKCSGVLERQPGDLIQKLMRNSSILPASTSTVVSNNNNNNVSLETTLPTPTATNDIVNINISNQKQHELSHELCLDDLLKESYEKLMKVNDNDTQLLPQIVADNAFETNTNIMSFGSSNNNNTMAINSNYGSNNNFPTLETINEDSIKELLYGHVGWKTFILFSHPTLVISRAQASLELPFLYFCLYFFFVDVNYSFYMFIQLSIQLAYEWKYSKGLITQLPFIVNNNNILLGKYIYLKKYTTCT